MSIKQLDNNNNSTSENSTNNTTNSNQNTNTTTSTTTTTTTNIIIDTDNIMFNNFLQNYNLNDDNNESNSLDDNLMCNSGNGGNNNNNNNIDANLIKFITTCNVNDSTASLLQNQNYNLYQNDNDYIDINQNNSLTQLNTTIITLPQQQQQQQQLQQISPNGIYKNIQSAANVPISNSTQAIVINNSAVNNNNCLKLKKVSKKKSQITNEVDEERTSQLVLELLKNIKEKTKELESLNQNVKCSKTHQQQQIQSTSSQQQQHTISTSTFLSLQPLSPSSSSSSSVSTPIQTQSTPLQAATTTTTTCFQLASPPPSSFNTTSIRKPKRSNKTLKAPKLNPNVLTQCNTNRNTLMQISNDQQKLTNETEDEYHEIFVPNGWKRSIDENGLVIYISPSNVILKTKQEINNYLLSENTCKCGLECPLDINQTFNFDPKYITKYNSNNYQNENNDLNNKTCCLHIAKQNSINQNKSLINGQKSVKRKKLDQQRDDLLLPKKKGRKPKQIKFDDISENIKKEPQNKNLIKIEINNEQDIKLSSQCDDNNITSLNGSNGTNNNSNNRLINNDNKKTFTDLQYKNLNKQKINSIISLDGFNTYTSHGSNNKINNHFKMLALSQQQQQQHQQHVNMLQSGTIINENPKEFQQQNIPITALFTSAINLANKQNNNHFNNQTQQQQQQQQNIQTTIDAITNDAYVLTTLSNCQIKLNNNNNNHSTNHFNIDLQIPKQQETQTNLQQIYMCNGHNGNNNNSNSNESFLLDQIQKDEFDHSSLLNKYHNNHNDPQLSSISSQSTSNSLLYPDNINTNKISMNMLISNKKDDDDEDTLMMQKHASTNNNLMINEIAAYDQLISAHMNFPQDLSELCKLVSDSSAIYNDSQDLGLSHIDSDEDFKLDVKYV